MLHRFGSYPPPRRPSHPTSGRLPSPEKNKREELTGAVMEKETYRDCMRNHAAVLGTYATDGCGEYTPGGASSLGALLCSACGCHRNFHRKVTPDLDTHHLHQLQPLLVRYPDHREWDGSASEGCRKRTRTKFSSEQKEKMMRFAERIGWRIPRRDGEGADELARFCREVGVSRQVFKVWMHNHKSFSASPSPAAAQDHSGAARGSNSPPPPLDLQGPFASAVKLQH